MLLETLDPQPLSDATLISLWSDAAPATAPDRARAMLRAAFPNVPEGELDDLPIGAWNAGLLRIRRQQFGDDFVLVDRCPHCVETVELRVPGDRLRPADTAVTRPPQALQIGECTITARLLTGADWRAASRQPAADAIEASIHLLRRAIVDARCADHALAADEIPTAVWEPLAEELAQADPWSEILFSLRCPRCSRSWESVLEPGDYVWRELTSAAQHALRQVHRLASAYGWAEAAILELPPDRRTAYIALLDEELGRVTDLFQAPLAAQVP